MHIQKTVELADLAEKNPERMHILTSESKRVRMLCSAERIEDITIHHTFAMQIPREKNLQYFILFSNVRVCSTPQRLDPRQ